MLRKQNQRKNIPSCERTDYACLRAARLRAWQAILHFQATTAGVDEERSDDDVSFIRKLITNTIHSQNIFRLTGFDFDLAANVLDVRVDRTFIGFKCYAMDRIQQLGAGENA